MKSLNSLHTKETINWTKGQILLTTADTKTNSPCYGMIARTKNYIFTGIFLAVFPMASPFWPASAVSRAILKPIYQCGIPNSEPQTLKSVDFWCKLLSHQKLLDMALPAQLMFCIIWFSKQKSSSSKQQFHWRTLQEIFPVKTTWKWCHLVCNFFVIHIYLFTEDYHKAWSFKLSKLSAFISHLHIFFAFSTYINGNLVPFYELYI